MTNKGIIKNRLGLILAESLVAIATLATGSIVLTTIVTNALTATQISKDYMIAQNLVTEAIEGVKNIRDTNWLLKPGKPDCWLALGVTADDPGEDCQNKQKIEPNQNGADQYYILTLASSGWKMVSSNKALNLSAANASGALAAQDEFRLYKKDGKITTSLAGAVPTKYYRSLKVETVKPDYAVFEAQVQWQSGTKVYTIKRTFALYNYLQIQ